MLKKKEGIKSNPKLQPDSKKKRKLNPKASKGCKGQRLELS